MKLVEYMGYKKPEFKDAEEGIDVKKIRDHLRLYEKYNLVHLIDWNYIKLYKKYIKILEEEFIE